MDSAHADLDSEQHCGLVVQLASRTPPVLPRLLHLVLNCQYGLDAVVVRRPVEISAALVQYGSALRCIFVIQDREIKDRNELLVMSRRGVVPLFLLVPAAAVTAQQAICAGLKNVFVSGWEDVFGQSDSHFHDDVAGALEDHDIKGVLERGAHVPHAVLQKRIKSRLKHLQVFPTLPDVVAHLMRVLNDPNSTPEELEEVVLGDPAIAHKLLQVMNSPLFAGSGRKNEWTLKEAIVRLGRNKVATMAQQVMLMNSLVKPTESRFDLRRFWEHSVGCAVIADRLCESKLIPLPGRVPFNDYWMGALLHDIGKLILGLFFWDHFEEVLKQAERTGSSFPEAEAALSDAVNHEYLGRVLVLNADGSSDLAQSVGTHHHPDKVPRALTTLIHLADNLCKDLELGYLPHERGVYSPWVLSRLNLKRGDLQKLREGTGAQLASEIRELASRCTEV